MPLFIPHEIGKIKSFFLAPCQPSPAVFVEAAVVAALTAVWTVAEPDVKEAFHRARGKSLVCSLKEGIIDAEVEQPFLSKGARKFLFTASEWADLAVWYLFLNSVAESGLSHWMSLTYELGKCDDMDHHGSDGSYSPFGALDCDDQWHVCLPWWVGWGADYPAMTPDHVLDPGRSGYIACAVSWTNRPEVGVPEMALMNLSTGEIYDHDQAADDPELHTKSNMLWAQYRNDTEHAHRVAMMAKCETIAGDSPSQIFPHTGYLSMYPKG